MIDGHEIVVTASIGFATNSASGITADDMLRAADAAMYQAKAGGRDRVARFTDDVRDVSRGRLLSLALCALSAKMQVDEMSGGQQRSAGGDRPRL